ncbi:hypothetical protein DesyoDRAFT_0741 [Desulfosporosinus youngiae DSM 17734]|uniref:Cytotoxic translational repressor n=1 Tax=Desulfosporosinus youngiae DSM 17734 TaxID=768710 RepID=H5XSV4_9FIRM|nr:hypothetical protein DesyoDRAFT_0741 [Desulfosporosinus youngiae DSM 17734]
MKISFTRRFIRSYDKLPRNIQSLFNDKLHQFMDDWRHPSFRIHELGGTDKVWSASLNMSIRFTFRFEKDSNGIVVCVMRNIGDHSHTMRSPY